MTRINCVPVETLHNSHALAEYRELPRVFKLAYNAVDRGFKQDINTYRMGTGHVKFFYDKLMYLSTRHQQLVDEMQKRGFTTNIIDVGLHWIGECDNKHNKLWNDWLPSEVDMKVNQDRIDERLGSMKK